MKKILLMCILLAILCCLANSQNRLPPRPEHIQKANQRANQQANNRGRPNHRPHGLKALHQQKQVEYQAEKQAQDKISQKEKNSSRGASEQGIKQHKQKLGIEGQSREMDQEKKEKPLIKLIFILVIALILIVAILLFKLFSNKQAQTPQSTVSVTGLPNSQPVVLVYPEIKLQDEIQMHRKRLQHLQKLKRIKEKYLVATANSQSQLGAQQKKIEEQLKTPAFSIPYTFRTSM